MCSAPKGIIIKTMYVCVCVRACVWPIWDVYIVLQLCLDGLNSNMKCLYYSLHFLWSLWMEHIEDHCIC